MLVGADPVALASAKLSLADLRGAIESGNRNDGAGRLTSGEESLIVRAVGAIRTINDLQSLVLASRAGRAAAAARPGRGPARPTATARTRVALQPPGRHR